MKTMHEFPQADISPYEGSLKQRLNEIEDEKLNEYLTRRVITLTPEEILYVSKELNPIFSE